MAGPRAAPPAARMTHGRGASGRASTNRLGPCASREGTIRPMYVVILAGGGGTRLWPLSTPARPKPFLPLLGSEPSSRRPSLASLGLSSAASSILGARAPPTAARPRPAARHQRRGGAGGAEHRRRHRPRHARHRPARRRGHGRPAGRPRHRRGRAFRSVLAAAADRAGAAAHSASRRRSSPSASRSTGRRPSTATSAPTRSPATARRAPRLPAAAPSRRSPTSPGPPSCSTEPGVAWNAGMFLWRRGAIRDALEKYAPDVLGGVADALAPEPRRLEPALRRRPRDLDRPRGHGAGAPATARSSWRRWTSAGATSAAGRRCSRRSARTVRGGRVVPARRVGRVVGPDDLVVQPVATARSSSRMAHERVSSTRTGRRALLAGARADRSIVRVAPRPRAAHGDPRLTTIAEAPGTDADRLRDRWLAGQDRRRVHVRERPPLRRRRRPLRRRQGRAGEGRRHRLRPAVRLGALRDRRPPRSSSPTTSRSPTRTPPCRPRWRSYEVVERGAAAGIVITASHNPWTDNGFKVKAPTGAAAGPEHADGHRGGDRHQRRHGDRAPAVRRRGGRRPRRAVRPVRRLRALRPPDRRPRRPEGGRRPRSSSTRCTAPARAGSRASSPAAGSG